MEPKDVMDIPTMDAFNKLLASLNLTDRQRKVFVLKYSNGWSNTEISTHLGVNQDTISDDIKVIRKKLLAIHKNNFNNI